MSVKLSADARRAHGPNEHKVLTSKIRIIETRRQLLRSPRSAAALLTAAECVAVVRPTAKPEPEPEPEPRNDDALSEGIPPRVPTGSTGAWQYNRPCAQKYVGKSESCMVIEVMERVLVVALVISCRRLQACSCSCPCLARAGSQTILRAAAKLAQTASILTLASPGGAIIVVVRCVKRCMLGTSTVELLDR